MLSPRTLRFFDSTANGQKLFPYMNKAYLYDSTDPGFVLPPTNQIGIKTFLYMKWWCCSDTTWACFPDLSLQHIWPLKENLAYTNPTLLTAGMGDFPLGDLYHWFPDKYSQWKSQEEIENARISTWLSTGADPGSVVDVKEQPGNNSPASFVLSQNYPNPFNPTTVINYTIGGVRDQGSGVTDVRLGVYDLLGREVAVLVNEWKAAGSYEVVFDAADLASGVYLCRLQAPISSGQAGTFVDVKKLVVLK
jgi:hypothetical protein